MVEDIALILGGMCCVLTGTMVGNYISKKYTVPWLGKKIDAYLERRTLTEHPTCRLFGCNFGDRVVKRWHQGRRTKKFLYLGTCVRCKRELTKDEQVARALFLLKNLD